MVTNHPKKFVRVKVNAVRRFDIYLAVEELAIAEGFAMVRRKEGEPFVVHRSSLWPKPPPDAYRVDDDWEDDTVAGGARKAQQKSQA